MRKHWFTHKAIRNVPRGQQGTSALEFALIAPVMITFLIGIVELGMIMFVTITMDEVVNNVARTGKTGYTASDSTRQDTITAQLNAELGNLIDTTQLTFTSTAYGDLNQIGVSGEGTNGLGTANQIVVYTVSYPWHLFTPMLSQCFGTGGVYTISVRTVVKNEPYGT